MNFFSFCVKYNKPCVIRNLAKDWPALKKWNSVGKYTEDNSDFGTKYINNLLGDTTVSVYVNDEIRTDSFVQFMKLDSFAERYHSDQNY